ncbi:uncharacterized protein B0H18DRAFT_1031591 [Fomitopsis serialis]|uniref:uncharacterized protein n=1 Tax=Fomitopsis serialis TaxID=139415 RepID=UPI002007EEB2|nr:uncharacterized protein B0H18DRAFT_1031591 [Neoantrodia serialis]KAH9918329.1 hypothetical protein B0H18DRAFT_1031591 [Neoantrodia serialis]
MPVSSPILHEQAQSYDPHASRERDPPAQGAPVEGLPHPSVAKPRALSVVATGHRRLYPAVVAGHNSKA